MRKKKKMHLGGKFHDEKMTRVMSGFCFSNK